MASAATLSTQRDQELLADWQAACRADEVLRTLPAPTSHGLVQEVAGRVIDGGGSPDVVLSALAAGLAAGDWHASGEVLQKQIGTLMKVLAAREGADHRRAAHVHTVLSAAAAAVAIEAWRDRAEQDELTALRNRAGWERDSKLAVVAAQPLVYASIDIDGLKAINDGPGGHPAGDELLRTFARRLEIAVRGRGGSAYRYGGDEFSAMLQVEAGNFDEILEGLTSEVGVPAFSHGVARWPDEDPDLHTVMSRADERMFIRKRERKAAKAALDEHH